MSIDTPLRIVFMGTSDFSLKALRSICANKFNVVGVYSQPPRPAGRNYALKKSVVHEFVENEGIPIFTPTSLKNDTAFEEFKSLQADVAVVASYGLIIPQRFLETPQYGFINIHASLLPRWRGASPIQSALLNGDHETGITIMKMDAGVDTGDIISMQSLPISQKTTFGELSEDLGNLGAKMIVQTLHNLDDALRNCKKQSEEGAIYAKKISKDSCKIDWGQSAEKILHQIKAFSPTPAAWTEVDGIRVKILDAELCGESCNPSDEAKSIIAKCGIGSIRLTLLQPAGKNPMSGEAFLRGHKSILIGIEA